MQTTWRVERVEMTEGKTEARLVKVRWWRENPAYVAMMDEYDEMVERIGREATDAELAEREDQPFHEQFLDAEPGEEDAEFTEEGSSMLLDITDTDGLELRPGDNVVVTFDALPRG